LTLKESALLYDEGKEKILDTFKGDKLMIGDGMSDYSVYKNKSAKMYCGFGINKVRYNVKNNCVNDHSGNVIYIEKTTDYFQLEKLIKKFVDINS
jgi:hypothetical protein